MKTLTEQAFDHVIPAITIWREARGEPFSAKIGVAFVIRNRAADLNRWPTSPAQVCVQPWQFSSWRSDDPNATKWPRSRSPWADSCAAWEASASMPDPTRGANHYHSYSREEAFPNWAEPGNMTCIIGAFKFYRL